MMTGEAQVNLWDLFDVATDELTARVDAIEAIEPGSDLELAGIFALCAAVLMAPADGPEIQMLPDEWVARANAHALKRTAGVLGVSEEALGGQAG
jgi:hypothetical protein